VADRPPIVIRWAPRVRQAKVRQLYLNDAAGIYDEELIDDVGSALYARARSTLLVTDAMDGRVHCPGCDTIIARQGYADELVLVCPSCQWQMTWGRYRRTFRGKKLYAGALVEALRTYMASFDRARSPREKVLAIDLLIHTFHHQAAAHPTAPAAKNLIEGNVKEVLALLDQLASGSATPDQMRQVKATYHQTLARSWAGGVMPEKVVRRWELRRRREKLRRAASASLDALPPGDPAASP
jgi:hypothetical protein